MEVKNYIARLNEFVQKSHLILTFKDICTDGPDHCRIFTVRAVINDKDYPVGVGRNKKEARQNAAKNALDAIHGESVQQSDSADVTRPSESPLPQPHPRPFTQANYVCWLNEYSLKMRVNCMPKESTKIGPGYSSQCCRYVVDGKEFPEAYANTKKEAKELAAKAVYEVLMGGSNNEPVDESQTGASHGQEEAMSLSVSPSFSRPSAAETSAMDPEKNYIGALNEYCQKTKHVCDYKLVKKKGLAHCPIFVYRVVIDKNEYPEYQGKTAKEAKQGAAQLAWEALKEQPDWDSQVFCQSVVTGDSTCSAPYSVRDPEDNAGKDNEANASSESIIFKESPEAVTPKMAWKSGDVKPKRILAPNFSNVVSKENGVKSNNLGKNSENIPKSPVSLFLTEYDQIEPIGKGGFGRVFKARKKIENKDVAVKIVKSTKKALREIGALSDLQHPNIVRYYHAWNEKTRFQPDPSDSSSSTSDDSSSVEYMYIQMELCQRGTLRTWINKRNSSINQEMRRKEGLNILLQVANGVKYIHFKKLIHRDLKPSNILFASDKAVKIGDFGLVTSAESDSDEALLERTKGTGTRSYMSPEQRNQYKYDKEVDIFALGLIYFEVLWKMTTENEKSKIWNDVRRQKFPAQFCVNYGTECKLIERMLSEQPDDRPGAPEIASELEKYQTSVNEDQNALQEMKTI